MSAFHSLYVEKFGELITQIIEKNSEITLVIPHSNLVDIALTLRDDPAFQFNQLIDLCGIDYLLYGKDEWRTEGTTANGFGRARNTENITAHIDMPNRFAVIIHLLSLQHNERVRLKVFVDSNTSVQTLVDIWPNANWYEREAFDMFGIFFKGHPDLRRILTDYNFEGHPLRKDFPVHGEVEMRFDAAAGRVIYEPVDIVPRTQVPKVIREDNRYAATEAKNGSN